MWQGPGWWQASDGRWYPPHLHPAHRPVPPAQRSVLASRLTLIGAALAAIVGAFLPWVSVLGISVSGINGDGVITLTAGLVMLILGLACLSRHVAATIVLSVAGGLCSLIVLAVGVYDWNHVTSAGVTAGSGLTLTALSGVAGLVSCGLAVARH
jgi:hypothetical protein